ncbi:MAG: SusC/RagA family TonB-linked outer membrane protein [Balneolales bacterium]
MKLHNTISRICMSMFLLLTLSGVGHIAIGAQGQIDSPFLEQLSDATISTPLQDLTDLESILNEIERSYNISFLYDSGVVEGKYITKSGNRTDSAYILYEMLADNGLMYKKETDRSYVIMPKPEAEKNIEVEQQEPISGQVTDAVSSESLPGVNVIIKGTTTGTATNAEGHFEFNTPSLQDTLVFSYVGYQTLEVPINGRSEINVQLDFESLLGEDMVVVGYGVQRQIDMTGSVSAVRSEDLDSRPSGNMTSLLQGKSPGVTITQSSGQPGQEGISMLIRGVGTMNNSSPMVIVDGVEASMNDVNPNDVESVSILKDASSASIYGSRAANGVILVTTKRGEVGSPQISYKSYIGRQQATRLPNYVSSADYATLLNEANRNDGLAPIYTQEEVNLFQSGEDPYNYPNTDWHDLLLQGSGLSQNHNLSISGGNEANRYRISMGYNEQKGLMERTNSDRKNLRVNFDSQVNDWFDMGLNAALSQRDVTNPTNPFGSSTYQFFRQVNRIPPIVANQFADGTWDRHDDGNPIAWVEESGMSTTTISHLIGSMFGEVKLMEELSLRGTASTNYELTDGKDHVKTISYGDGTIQEPNSVEDQIGRNSYTILEAVLEYNKDHGRHGVNGLVGAYRKDESYNELSAYRRSFPSNLISELTAGSQEGWSNNGYADESKLGSYFGRINYNYDEKYLFQANLRRDGSSLFAEGQRWGWFPSFSAGWRITEEDFMEVSWLSNLKIRGSWGQLGNNRIGNYRYMPLISFGQNYNFGGSVAGGAAQTSAANPDITWETTTELDIGLDAYFFENRFSVIFDYYDRYTDDILTSVPVSDIYGLPAPTVNAGAMRNRGVELEIGHINMIEDFQYSVSLHGAFNKNKVERYENPDIGTSIRKEGVSWDSYYGYEAAGQFQSQEDVDTSPHTSGTAPGVGDLKYKDQNDDGVIDGDDRIVLGNTIPEITFGFNLGANYKGFDASVFLQGADRVYRTIHPEAMWPFQNGGKVHEMHMDRTIVENNEIVQHGHYPRVMTNPTAGHTSSYFEFSSFSVLDAAYIRMKNIQFGYTLPTRWAMNSNIRVYFSGENLLTLTRDFPGSYDPESSDGVGYPQVKTYTLGLNITF